MTGEKEEVIKGSPRDKELRQKLDDIGLCEEGDPRYPNAVPFSEYMESEEYKSRKETMLKRNQDKQ